MAYLQSNIPHFKCWVRREYTCNHERYHGEFLHAMAIAVTTMPNRCLSFQVIFTGSEADEEGEENVHGGAMWARMHGLSSEQIMQGMGQSDNIVRISTQEEYDELPVGTVYIDGSGQTKKKGS